jgi:hypothetical protein
MNVLINLSYLVGLVVELSVVLADLSLLGVVPDRHSLVELGLLSPFLGIQEPIVAVSPLSRPTHFFFHRHKINRKSLTWLSRPRHRTCALGGIEAIKFISICWVAWASRSMARFQGPWSLAISSYQSQCVQSLGATLGLEHHAELVKLGNLLLCEVTSVAVLLLRALDREIIVVVLGVQIHGE